MLLLLAVSIFVSFDLAQAGFTHHAAARFSSVETALDCGEAVGEDGFPLAKQWPIVTFLVSCLWVIRHKPLVYAKDCQVAFRIFQHGDGEVRNVDWLPFEGV